MGNRKFILQFIFTLIAVLHSFFVSAFQISEITVTLDELENVICPGSSTGKISVSVTGGLGNLTYQWSGPNEFSATSQDIINLSEGIYSLTVSDSSSPTPITETIQFEVIQVDTESPIVIAPTKIEKPADPGLCTASLQLNNPESSDNCSVIEIKHNAPSLFPIGETVVIWTVKDSSGNITEVNQTINILDNEDPDLKSPPNITASTAPGECFTSTISLGNPIVSDNCDIKSVVNDAPGAFDIGETIVTWTATDISGNTATATQYITVQDLQDPNITAPADLSIYTNPSTCLATRPELGNPTTTDNCSVLTVTNNAPSEFPLGTTEVTWTVTDGSGNVDTDIQTITVIDNIKPTITAPSSLTLSTDPSSCSATGVQLGDPTATDNCSVSTVISNAPSEFPLGSTVVTWTVTDGSGNVNTDTQTVTVIDNIEPTITAPPSLTLSTDPSSCSTTGVQLGLPVTNDNCNIERIENTAPSSFLLGVTEVIWTVTDKAGNSASAIQTVTVKDTEVPTIEATENVVIQSDPGTCTATEVDLISPMVSDNCSIATIKNNAPEVFPLGNTTVTWTVTDEAGNIATAEQTITVEDTEKPSISAPPAITVNTDAGKCTASSVNLGSAVFSDNCGGATVSNNAPVEFPLGITEVIWTISDASGNTATAIQNITVKDSEKPQITAPATVTASATSGSCTATGIGLGTPVVSDNCSVAQVSNDSPSSFPLGNTTVTWTVVDHAGNSSSATQVVTIRDTEIPVIEAPSDISVSNQTGACFAPINITPPTVTDNCNVGNAVGTRSDSKALTAVFPVGTTTIIWKAHDANGNEALPVTQLITVLDEEPPVPPVLNDIIWGCEYTLSTPTTTDNCSGTINGVTNDPLTYSTPGTHTVSWTFTDASGNSTTVDQRVIIAPVTAVANISPVLCNGYSTGGVTIEASGGVGPYTYIWSTLGSGAVKENLSAGTYSVTVTDSKGCKMEPLQVVISEPETFIEITSVPYTVGCYGQNDATATVEVKGGTGNYNFLWSDSQTTRTATGLSPGDYSVLVTDENGCTATKSVTIPEAKELIVSGFSTTETTSFGSATGTAAVNITGGTAPFTFNWSNGQSGQIARNLKAGSYSVTVTDANGCSDTDSVIIIDSIEGTIVPSSLCLTEEGGIRVSTFRPEGVRGGTGPYAYSWNFGEGASPAVGSGPGPHVVEYSSTGDKTISMTITDSKGISFTETIIQYVGECFEICGNTSNFDIDLDTFYIGKEDGTRLTSTDCAYEGKKYIFLKSTTNANAYSPSVEYIYTLRDLNNSGAVVGTFKVISCLAEYDSATKQYKMVPELLNLGEVAEWSCGYSITMENFYMSWTNNFKRGCGENPRMMCLSTNEKDEIIYPLYASIKTTDLLCFGSSSGTLTVTASGGRAPYLYSVNGGAFTSSNVFTELDGGSYSVSVKDTDGQIYTAPPKEILEPSNPLQIQKPVVNTPVTCYGGSDGSATVEVSGGSPFQNGNPYIYIWSNNQTTATATGLSAGQYSVTIIDANGCELTETIIIEQPAFVPADAGQDIVLPCGTNSTTIGTHIPTGVSGSWQVVNGPSGWEIENPKAAETTFLGKIGTYTLRWTVSCGASDDVKITIGDCNTIDFDGIDDHIDFGNTYNLVGEFSFGAWVKPISITGIKTIFSKRSFDNYTGSGYDLVLNDGFAEFRWNGGKITSPFAVDTNRWYHITVTSDSSGTKLYVDGIQVASGASASPSENDTSFIIGALTRGTELYATTHNFHGWIEEVRIWNIALQQKELQFMMNQRLINNDGLVKGQEIPFNVPGDLSWTNLVGYYHMEIIQNGFTIGETPTSVKGKLRNITTLQQRSAPLPYVSRRAGNWNDSATNTTPWLYGQGVWDVPNSKGINNDTINWNIVRTSHDIESFQKDITLLGLISEKGKLTVSNGSHAQNEYNPGHSLRISHYLNLNGVIDLVGESQLLQDDGSILEENSTGYIERDQQGTASSYNYNYWSSPVSPTASPNNSPYTVEKILRDGTNSLNPIPLNFNYTYHYADWSYSGAKRVSSFWINIYTNKQSNSYSQWHNVREYGNILPGEGYTMKGTSGFAEITDHQNYVFVGKPHNGDIKLKVDVGNDYLIGNPYPSAIDGYKFIKDNIKDSGGVNQFNVFNGTLYFWDHFSGKTHYLQKYIGGYATLNLSGGLEAVATDERINATGEKAAIKPEQYIPVGQAFYVSTQLAPELENITNVSGGEIIFKNSQRVFETDDQADDKSVFKSQETEKSKDQLGDSRQKIYLHFRSPGGYHRQLLVTRDPNTTTGFDLGYDAPLIENNPEDLFWMINDVKFIIQGVPDFDVNRELNLGYKVQKAGTIKIEIDKMLNIPGDFNIYLKNKKTEEVHDLRSGAFEINTIAGEAQDQYSIIFKKEEETPEENQGGTEEETDSGEGSTEEENEIPTPEESGNNPEEIIPEVGEETAEEIKISYSNKTSEVVIKNPEQIFISKGILYNALGQKIMEITEIPADPISRISVGSRPAGVYIFKLINEGKAIAVKFIIE